MSLLVSSVVTIFSKCLSISIETRSKEWFVISVLFISLFNTLFKSVFVLFIVLYLVLCSFYLFLDSLFFRIQVFVSTYSSVYYYRFSKSFKDGNALAQFRYLQELFVLMLASSILIFEKLTGCQRLQRFTMFPIFAFYSILVPSEPLESLTIPFD